MTLKWLAAILNPRDIGSHPNFGDASTGIAPESALANLLLPSRATFDEQIIDYHGSLIDADEAEALLSATRELIGFGTVEVGAQKLADLSALYLSDERSLALAGATALLAATGFAEVDEYSRALGALDPVIAMSVADGSPDARLVSAACLQQSALRLYDWRHAGVAEARSASDILRAFDPSAASTFEVSPSVGWSSNRTLVDVASALDHASLRLRVQLADSDDEEWAILIRQGPPSLVLRNHLFAMGSYEKLVSGVLERKGNRSNSVRLLGTRYASAIESALWEAAMSAELLGHPSARNFRQDLAVYRLVGDSRDPGLIKDSLRLLRQARSRRDQVLALNNCRAAGPLSSLREETLQVVSRRLFRGEIGRAELETIRVGSDTLAPEDASDALRALVNQLSLPELVSDGRSGLQNSWHYDLLRAALSLVRDDADWSIVANALFSSLDAVRVGFDFADEQYRHLVEQLKWECLDPVTRSVWESRFRDDLGHTFPKVREVISLHWDVLGITGVGEAELKSLDWIAASLNIQLHGGAPFPVDQVVGATDRIRMSLAEIESGVAEGRFGFGGHQPVDLAVAFSLHVEVDALWPQIWRILSNPAVLRPITRNAFERLSRSDVNIPAVPRDEFSARSDALLDARQSPMEELVTPYPEVLRFLAASRIIPSSEVLRLVSLLAFSGDPEARREGAATIAVLSRRRIIFDWAAAVVFGLTHDADPAVQAEASRALALLSRGAGALREMAHTRMAELLDVDGARVPLFALGGLMELGADEIPQPLQDRVWALTKESLSAEVRRMARKVVLSWSAVSRG